MLAVWAEEALDQIDGAGEVERGAVERDRGDRVLIAAGTPCQNFSVQDNDYAIFAFQRRSMKNDILLADPLRPRPGIELGMSTTTRLSVRIW